MVSEIRQIQLHSLKILNTIDSICTRHNIKYSLCGGSVVGAHLYGGFLPWDDDIDLMMTREHYNHFLDIAPKELPSYFSLHNYNVTEDFTTPFTKIVDNRTTIIQQDGTISGIFLDITVYDKIPDNLLSKVDNLLWKISQIVMIGKIEPKGKKEKIRNFLLDTVLSNQQKYLKFFEKIAVFLGKNTRKYHYSELFGAFANTTRYKPSIFENYDQIMFEDKNYMIVKDYVEYLVTRYNRTDFHEPKEKQIAPHYQYVNFYLPYKEYIQQHGQ